MVGMGLKEAGLPVTVWEAWSARDGGRYHKGECARKWESFHGSTKPVTESSIFQLAYSHGWSGPAGHALDLGRRAHHRLLQNGGAAGGPPVGGIPRSGSA